MSTHGAPGRSGATYQAGSYRAQEPPPSPGLAAAPARRNRRPPIGLGVLAVVLVLCIGGGAAAYHFLVAAEPPTDGSGLPAMSASASPVGSAPVTPAASAAPSGPEQSGDGEEDVSGDLSGYKRGDCLTVDEPDDNRVEKAKCTDPGAQKVLLRRDGTHDDAVCGSVGATFSLSQDASGSTKDFVLCVGPVD